MHNQARTLFWAYFLLKRKHDLCVQNPFWRRYFAENNNVKTYVLFRQYFTTRRLPLSTLPFEPLNEFNVNAVLR